MLISDDALVLLFRDIKHYFIQYICFIGYVNHKRDRENSHATFTALYCFNLILLVSVSTS